MVMNGCKVQSPEGSPLCGGQIHKKITFFSEIWTAENCVERLSISLLVLVFCCGWVDYPGKTEGVKPFLCHLFMGSLRLTNGGH